MFSHTEQTALWLQPLQDAVIQGKKPQIKGRLDKDLWQLTKPVSGSKTAAVNSMWKKSKNSRTRCVTKRPGKQRWNMTYNRESNCSCDCPMYLYFYSPSPWRFIPRYMPYSVLARLVYFKCLSFSIHLPLCFVVMMHAIHNHLNFKPSLETNGNNGASQWLFVSVIQWPLLRDSQNKLNNNKNIIKRILCIVWN